MWEALEPFHEAVLTASSIFARYQARSTSDILRLVDPYAVETGGPLWKIVLVRSL